MPSRNTDLFMRHERIFQANRFVYPVLSRRSGGLSLGVNLNPDKICNFDCIYCQVDRTSQAPARFVEIPRLLDELDHSLRLVTSGEIYKTEKFAPTPADWRRLGDIAFSGDGEPTTYRNFDEIVTACAEVKNSHGLDHVKMVLITNASMFHRDEVQRGLVTLDENNGEIWAKLDAGSEAYYKQVERTPIPFGQVLDNIAAVAKQRAVVIQSIFMKIHGKPPDEDEQFAYCQRLNDMTAAGGQIKTVQIYTIARQPAESYVSPLDDRRLDAIARLVAEQTGLSVTAFK